MLVCGAISLARTAVAEDDVVIRASLDAKKISLGEPVRLEVSLINRTNAALDPLQITVTPDWGRTASSRREPLAAGASRTYDFQLHPKSTGIFVIHVGVAAGSRSLGRVEAGTLDVVEQPSWIAPYRDVVPIVASVVASVLVLVGTFVTLFFTVKMQGKTLSVTTRTQRKILQEARRQKAAEAVSQIVHQIARDYYGTVSGATWALSEAVRRLAGATPEQEKEHLLIRAFFFYGTLLYGDNEFRFRQSLLFLPDLWAEADLRHLVDDVLSVVPLTQEQEALVHKCFSDIAIVARQGDLSTVSIRARNLYEFELLLRQRSPSVSGVQLRIQEVFDSVRSRFMDTEVRRIIADATMAMGSILEYEFTVMYSDFYTRPAADGRTRPATLPEFDRIVRIPTWPRTSEALERLDRLRKEQKRDRESLLPTSGHNIEAQEGRQ